MNNPSGTAFVPAEGSARWVRGLMVATVVLLALSMLSGLLQVGLLNRAATVGISMNEALLNDARERVIGVLELILWIATAVAFMIWFHRVHKNLPALGGRGLKYSPGWAVGGFFVPFLNLFRPPQVMGEVWHGSDPSGLERDLGPDGPAIRNKLAQPSQVSLWWGLYILAGLIAYAALRIALNPTPAIVDLMIMTWVEMLSDLVSIPSALLAIQLVKRVTAWQGERAQGIRGLGVEVTAVPTGNPVEAV